jgi:hypothetical protein
VEVTATTALSITLDSSTGCRKCTHIHMDSRSVTTDQWMFALDLRCWINAVWARMSMPGPMQVQQIVYRTVHGPMAPCCYTSILPLRPCNQSAVIPHAIMQQPTTPHAHRITAPLPGPEDKHTAKAPQFPPAAGGA